MRFIYALFIFLFLTNPLFSQNYSSLIINKKTKLPIEYVNIGIVGKNVGTVSDINGKYDLTIDSQFNNDTLLVSCIGYYPFSIKISDYHKLADKNIYLDEKIFEIHEVVIKPKDYKQKILGVESKSKIMSAGFKENKLGYELGILMKVKKSAILEKVIINFSACSYDTIFYRLNIYKCTDKMQFENILQKPIYIKLPKDKIHEPVLIDLKPIDLVVQGDFLVTLEHVKDLGPGYLYFCAGIGNKTYYRKTSQGIWETAPVGISISVDAKVEK